MNKRTFGRIGENAALSHLKKRGYRIVTTNYGTSRGELDVVAFKRGILVFAEVKTKTDIQYGVPADELTGTKKAALRRAGTEFCKSSCRGFKVPVKLCGIRLWLRYRRCRFDLIELIIADGEILRLIHTKDVIKAWR